MNVTSVFKDNVSSYNATRHLQRSMCESSFSWIIHGPLMAFCALIIASNSVVIALMCWKETLRTLSNILLVSLAVSDLLSGLVGIPLFSACAIVRPISLITCISSALFMRFTAISTMLHFGLIACDRYAMITHPMRYHTIVTRTRVVCTLTAVWFISPIVSVVQMAWYNPLNDDVREKKREDEVYIIFLMVAFFALPLLCMLCSYSRILIMSLRLVFAARARRANLGDGPVNSIARDLRGTVIVISMLVVFAGCWLPSYLMILQDHLSVKIIPIRSWGLCLFPFLRFIPPMCNPAFCAFCKRDFRRALRLWIRTRAVCKAQWYNHRKSTRQGNIDLRVTFTRSQEDPRPASDRNGTAITVETSLQRTPSPLTFRGSVNRIKLV